MQRVSLIAQILSVALGTFAFIGPAGISKGIAAENEPLASFQTGKDGRMLVVPVLFKGQFIPFLVDTAAAKTTFDLRYRNELGVAVDSTLMTTSARSINAACYKTPEAHVGPLDLRQSDTVIAYDLSPIRHATGQEIYGVLGMDFLRHFAMEIDFDRGTISLFQSAPPDWAMQGERTPLTPHEGGVVVDATISGFKEPFLLDTGANAAYLHDGIFDLLLRIGKIQVGGASQAVTVGGNIKTPAGYLKDVRLCSFSHESIRASRDSKSGIGLQYLSRFLVRCDFPNNVAIFSKGALYSRPEPVAKSGMSILVLDGQKTVVSVEQGGAASQSGVIVGDVIATVDGVPASAIDMHDFGRLLMSEVGRRITIEITRNGQTTPVVLTLQSRL